MRETTLGSIAQIFDGPHATPTRMDSGPYFLNISSLDNGRLDLAQSDHVSEEDYEKWTKRVTPTGGDLLFSYETRLGEAALMPHGVVACLGRRMALLRFDLTQVVPEYFLYHYLSPGFQRTIESRTIHGATVNRIALSSMADWTVRIPGLPEQKAVAEVLGALDEKIAANRRIIETSDSIANHLVRLSLSRIKTTAVSAISSITMGQSPPGESFNESGEGVVFYQGNRDFGFRYPVNRLWTSDPKRMARAGDTLMSVRAPVGALNTATESTCIGRGLASIRSTIGTPSTIFHILKALPGLWDPYQSGGTVFGSINGKELNALQIPEIIGDRELLEERLASLDLIVASYDAESRTLTELRDSLLPRLMSGELRVRDAEKVVEEVL